MSEMIERVAKAIYEKWAQHEGSDCSWGEIVLFKDDEEFPNAQRFYQMAIDEARAAIEAMREPTDEMITAMVYCGMLDGDPEETWSKMIDEALK